jgi:hypothetical protein
MCTISNQVPQPDTSGTPLRSGSVLTCVSGRSTPTFSFAFSFFPLSLQSHVFGHCSRLSVPGRLPHLSESAGRANSARIMADGGSKAANSGDGILGPLNADLILFSLRPQLGAADFFRLRIVGRELKALVDLNAEELGLEQLELHVLRKYCPPASSQHGVDGCKYDSC